MILWYPIIGFQLNLHSKILFLKKMGFRRISVLSCQGVDSPTFDTFDTEFFRLKDFTFIQILINLNECKCSLITIKWNIINYTDRFWFWSKINLFCTPALHRLMLEIQNDESKCFFRAVLGSRRSKLEPRSQFLQESRCEPQEEIHRWKTPNLGNFVQSVSRKAKHILFFLECFVPSTVYFLTV